MLVNSVIFREEVLHQTMFFSTGIRLVEADTVTTLASIESSFYQGENRHPRLRAINTN